MTTILVAGDGIACAGYECYWWDEGDPKQGVERLRQSDLGKKYPAVVKVAETLVQQGGGAVHCTRPPVLGGGWIVCVGDAPTPRLACVSHDRLVVGYWQAVAERRTPLGEWTEAVRAILKKAGMEQDAAEFLGRLSQQQGWPKLVVWPGVFGTERIRVVPVVPNPLPKGAQ